MALGVIKQFKGPYNPSRPGSESKPSITLSGNACRIGISISEDDFMSWGANKNTGTQYEKDFVLIIKGQQIHMGRTYMYQSQQAINQPIPIYFPEGAPTSLIIDVVYSNDYIEEE